MSVHQNQITALMQALQLANRRFELHRRKQKGAFATLDAVESIFGDPKVVRAEVAARLIASPAYRNTRPPSIPLAFATITPITSSNSYTKRGLIFACPAPH